MKKCWIVGLALVLLCGCGAQQTFEPVWDDYEVQAAEPVRELRVSLPEEAAQPVLQSSDAGKLYFCDGYTVTLQTLAGGDIERTLRSVTGYRKECLDLVVTQRRDAACYECAWSSAGEGTQQVGRTVILDDGQNHHAVTVMADAEKAGQLRDAWDDLLSSAHLTDTD